MQPDFEPITPATIEWFGAIPFAPGFGDSYFSRDDGRAESATVFIEGNALPQRFEALARGERIC